MNLKIERLEIPQEPELGTKQLYVVLHGLVSIVETDDALHLFLLDMNDQHEYRAGGWLDEKEIPKGTTGELGGVVAGKKKLDPLVNPLLHIAALPDPGAKGVHAVFKVPLPKDILSFDRGEIKITGGAIDKLVAQPKTLAAVRVLVYDVETSVDSVSLTGKFGCKGEKTFSCGPGKTSTNFTNGSILGTLHIFDMPGGPLADGSPHHVEEFALSSSVLGAPIQIDAAVPKDLEDGQLPAGLSELELLAFDARPEVSKLVLDFIRLGQWVPGGGTGGSCEACCGGADGKTP